MEFDEDLLQDLNDIEDYLDDYGNDNTNSDDYYDNPWIQYFMNGDNSVLDTLTDEDAIIAQQNDYVGLDTLSDSELYYYQNTNWDTMPYDFSEWLEDERRRDNMRDVFDTEWGFSDDYDQTYIKNFGEFSDKIENAFLTGNEMAFMGMGTQTPAVDAILKRNLFERIFGTKEERQIARDARNSIATSTPLKPKSDLNSMQAGQAQQAKTMAQADGNTKLEKILDGILKYGEKALAALSKAGVIENKNVDLRQAYLSGQIDGMKYDQAVAQGKVNFEDLQNAYNGYNGTKSNIQQTTKTNSANTTGLFGLDWSKPLPWIAAVSFVVSLIVIVRYGFLEPQPRRYARR